ncbi:MAG: hypothetical protein ACPGYX_11045 [Oceanobacter sp.]
MKLPDFSCDQKFALLRQLMDAKTDGQFLLFDSSRHVSFQEQQLLENEGLELRANLLRPLQDETLAYKNRRVWVVELSGSNLYHLAECVHTHVTIRAGCSNNPVVTAAICLDCLAQLRFDGMDARRLRRQEYAEQVQKQFDLDRFWTEYPYRLD